MILVEVQNGTKSILLVDDDHSWLVYVSILLKHPALSLISTTSPAHAMNVMANFMPDVLVTDTNMPTISGIQLLLDTRKLYPTLPVVVFFSGLLDSPITERDVLAMGATKVLPKWEAETLQAELCSLLGLAPQ